MRDEKICKTFFLLELFKKVKYLCTNGYVKCRDRLIGNDELRLHYNGTGNADTLSLSAGELVRVTGKVLGK